MGRTYPGMAGMPSLNNAYYSMLEKELGGFSYKFWCPYNIEMGAAIEEHPHYYIYFYTEDNDGTITGPLTDQNLSDLNL